MTPNEVYFLVRTGMWSESEFEDYVDSTADERAEELEQQLVQEHMAELEEAVKCARIAALEEVKDSLTHMIRWA